MLLLVSVVALMLITGIQLILTLLPVSGFVFWLFFASSSISGINTSVSLSISISFNVSISMNIILALITLTLREY